MSSLDKALADVEQPQPNNDEADAPTDFDQQATSSQLLGSLANSGLAGGLPDEGPSQFKKDQLVDIQDAEGVEQ